MSETNWVFVNGDFVAAEAAHVSPFDRGFLFAHAAYEVTAIYKGRFIDLDRHLARLTRTLDGLEIELPELDFVALHQELVRKNEIEEGLVYVQVTAGTHGPRDFFGPERLISSVFAFASKRTLIGEAARTGITAISTPDTRWARRDLKTTQLVSQSLAYRAARRVGADTAIMHENSVVTEAASANLWIVDADGTLITRQLSSALLPGITRARVLDLLGPGASQIEERAFTLEELAAAREAFTTSTGLVIAPILSVDGQAIGTGSPGDITRKIQAAYYTYIGADISEFDWL